MVFSKTLEFINAFDLHYDPLKDKKYWGAKMQALMNNFAKIIQAMNEKRDAYTKAHPDKVVEIHKRINNINMVSLGQYTLQKRIGYVVVQSVQQTPLQQRQRPESPLAESAPKR